MQIYSLSSVIFSFIGMLFVGLSFILSNFVEYLFAVGMIFLLVGAFVSLKAMTYQETGYVKFVSMAVFFLTLLIVVMVAPFHIVRLFTWVKNWPMIEELFLRMKKT
ncbi:MULTISPECIES: hypothetical protein [Bacillaceae]|uniref:hypothetical protein n=1 Tax=Bacillaceae TaxID=186817 RepID=UPI000E76B7D4|nr:hypothetical protein [Bacillus sp. PK3_68]RJS59952.1 hypothetical protein CJ483_07570 [Bacillus sp. PK3_68]